MALVVSPGVVPENVKELIKEKNKYHLSTRGDAAAWIVATVILPSSYIATRYLKFKSLFVSPKTTFSSHQKKVQRVCSEVKSWRAQDPSKRKNIRTDRSGYSSHTVRVSDKTDAHIVHLRDLNLIVNLDKEKKTVFVEPAVTVGQITKFLNSHNLQLEATLEMEDATLGGLVLAIGMTTHSHVCGLTSDIVVAYELVTSNGELIKVTADNQHSDLFRALPWSNGTLGLLVGLELRVTEAPDYVLLTYTPFYSQEEYASAYQSILHAEKQPFFLEMIIFSKSLAVLMTGERLESSEAMEIKGVKVNKLGRANAPWFYKHVESMLEKGSTRELIPIYDYLMRHDRSMCMTMGVVIPFGNEPWFRNTLGFMTPPNMKILKSLQRDVDRTKSMRERVWQDGAFPAKKFMETIDKVHELFEIYPLLCYPCKVFDYGGFIRLRDENGNKLSYDGTKKFEMFLNFGIYGTPKALREGKKFKTVHAVRQWEAYLRSVGGFQHTYCDSFMTEEEFEQMFDHTLWEQMRAKYDCKEAFKTIYQKTRPELDFRPWQKEEETWEQ